MTAIHQMTPEKWPAIPDLPPRGRISGIYRITCTATGRIYIGSAEHIYKRWREHRHHLHHGKHHSQKLQHAWNKYGKGAFRWDVVELADAASLIITEQRWLDLFNLKAHFNVSPTALSPKGVRHRPEVRAAATARLSEWHRNPAGMSLAQKRRFARPEERQWLADKQSAHWLVTPPGGSPRKIFNLKRFCRESGLMQSHMSEMGRGERPQLSYRGWGCVKLDPILKMSRKPRPPRQKPEPRPIGKTWYVVSPEGENVVTASLRMFCEEHDLSYSAMRKIGCGILKQHRGWKCYTR